MSLHEYFLNLDKMLKLGFHDQPNFFMIFNLTLPPIHRLNVWYEIDSCDQLLFDQGLRKVLGTFQGRAGGKQDARGIFYHNHSYVLVDCVDDYITLLIHFIYYCTDH